jgi:hypothetical protein
MQTKMAHAESRFGSKADMAARHYSGFSQRNAIPQLGEQQAKGEKAGQSIIKSTFLSAQQAKIGREKE